MKKYEFTGETKVVFGITLHRIRALVDIRAGVKAGAVGGWIEKEENLDQDGEAWVSGEARVYGKARVSGEAQVYGKAWVSGEARVSGEAQVSCATSWMTCPEVGAFIGWKKARKAIVKLQITDDAKRSSAISRKCRCSKAVVLGIENLDGTPYPDIQVSSQFDSNFTYRVGETVEVPDFDENRWNECSTGIHFFITRQEAVDY